MIAIQFSKLSEFILLYHLLKYTEFINSSVTSIMIFIYLLFLTLSGCCIRYIKSKLHVYLDSIKSLSLLRCLFLQIYKVYTIDLGCMLFILRFCVLCHCIR